MRSEQRSPDGTYGSEPLQPNENSSAAWEVELARRAEEIRSGQAAVEAAESVFAALRAKYS